MKRIWMLALLLAACGSTASAACPNPPPDTAGQAAGCLRYGVAAGAQRYPTGAGTIRFTVMATNFSPQPCAGSSELLCGGPSLVVRDAAGESVWTRVRPAQPCPALVRLLQPGETETGSYPWDHGTLAGGLYTVEGGSGRDLGRGYFAVC